MADIILSRVTEKSQSDGTEKLLIEYQDDIYRMPLSEIVNNGGSSGSVLIDDTLTLSGYAADAAAAGDRISTVEDLISDGLAYVGDGVNDATTPINADTLGGKDISYFAQKSDIKPKPGFIYPLATPNVPDGFLLCDGKAYSRTEYVELFAAIGTYYGEGDGSTTFNVPDLQTRVPVGAGNGYALGDVGGEETHILTDDEMPSHSHITMTEIYGDVGGYGHTQPTQICDNNALQYDGAIRQQSQDAGGDQPHNNMQPYTVINYIISTGKDNTVYIRDVINGAQVMPLEVQYGGTGATNVDDARKNLGVKDYKRNLLDNSDFTNPVNQMNWSQSNESGKYERCIDRWETAPTTTAHLSSDGFVITQNDISQRLLATNMFGKSFTFAVCDVNKNITCASFTVPSAFSEWQGIVNLTLDWGLLNVYFATDNRIAFVINCKAEKTFIWAALYEGEYTAETLPPYVPKGYTAELLECRRCYRRYNRWNDIGSGYVAYNGGVYIMIPCDIPMRVNPTAVGNIFELRCNGNVISITKTPTVTKYNNVIELFFANETVATSYGNHPCYLTVGNSTFELNAEL